MRIFLTKEQAKRKGHQRPSTEYRLGGMVRSRNVRAHRPGTVVRDEPVTGNCFYRAIRSQLRTLGCRFFRRIWLPLSLVSSANERAAAASARSIQKLDFFGRDNSICLEFWIEFTLILKLGPISVNDFPATSNFVRGCRGSKPSSGEQFTLLWVELPI